MLSRKFRSLKSPTFHTLTVRTYERLFSNSIAFNFLPCFVSNHEDIYPVNKEGDATKFELTTKEIANFYSENVLTLKYNIKFYDEHFIALISKMRRVKNQHTNAMISSVVGFIT